ncbi:MAG: EamA family transporter [Maritimibacter sp.]|nr:EamA family transporter [Maritimibacter sp.]
MSILGFSLVLAAAFCHATWNYFVKRLNAGPELIWLFSVVGIVIYAPVAIWFALGWEATAAGFAVIAVSTVLHLAYFLLLQRGYREGDLSVVYPTARATGPLLSTSFAVVFLDAPMNPQMAVGGLVVVFGVLMLTGGQLFGGRRALVSLGFGLTVGIIIASYTVWDARAVGLMAIPPLLLDYASVIGRSVLLTPVARRRWGKVRALWRDHKPEVVVIAVFNTLAYVLVLVALTFTAVSYVAPIREVSVLLTVLMGSLLLGEGHLKRRLLWAGVILTGVAVLALG